MRERHTAEPDAYGAGRARRIRAWLPRSVVAWTLGVTVARGIRLPNDFAEAHWLLDYRFGFIKRGLVGSLYTGAVQSLGLEKTPTGIAVLAALTLACLLAVALVLLARVANRHDAPVAPRLVALLVASSPFVVMTGHSLGYFDAVLYLCAVTSAALVLGDRPFSAALVSSVGLLVHESYLVVGIPASGLALALGASSGRRPLGARAVVALAVPLVVAAAIGMLQGILADEPLLRRQIALHLDTFGFVSTRVEEVALWQTTGFWEFLRTQAWAFDDRLLDLRVWASVGPTLGALLYFVYSSFQVRPWSPASGLILSVVCAPLAMHALAWDTARISTFTIGGAFLALWLLAETRQARPPGPGFVPLALVVLVLNVFTSLPLLDQRVERFGSVARVVLYLPTLVFAVGVLARRNRRVAP